MWEPRGTPRRYPQCPCKSSSVTAHYAWYLFYVVCHWWRAKKIKLVRRRLNLSAATPPTLTGTIHLDLMTFQAHKRPRSKAHAKLTKSVKVITAFYQPENSISGSCKNLNLVHFLFIYSSMLPLSLHSVRERRNVVSLLMRPKTDCLFFFFFLILFTKNSLWETTWETYGALRHWLIIKHRSHSVLTQLLLLLTAAVTQSFQRNTQLPFTVMIYCITTTTLDLSVFLLISVKVVPHFSVSSYLEKNSMFKKLCLIILTRPSLDSVAMNHHHTYLLDVDQPSNWLPNVWLNCHQFYCFHNNKTVLQRCKISKRFLQMRLNMFISDKDVCPIIHIYIYIYIILVPSNLI